jgi:hypothetical protein
MRDMSLRPATLVPQVPPQTQGLHSAGTSIDSDAMMSFPLTLALEPTPTP